VLERAWNSIETNQFGTHEFIDWCRMVGTEPLLGMNFGTGSAEMAVACVEYCNYDRGTKWSDLRRSHGFEKPHNVRYWALRYARGRVLDLRVESETYPITAAGLQADFARNDQVPFVDVVATLDVQAGQACLLMLNRDLAGERELALEWRDITPTRVLACETLTGPDLKAFNTFEEPRRVAPQRLEPPAAGARMTFKLPARSYTVAQLATTT
jgi:alpha-L-arabinofuranosidase